MIRTMFRLVLFALTAISLVACKTTKPDPEPPSVSTEEIIKSLKETQEHLDGVGLDSSRMGLSVDRALTLAERLEILLEKIEQEQRKYRGKNVIPPLL